MYKRQQKRLAIKTFVRHEDNFFVKEALIRELRRGGQAYVIHNEVRTINNKLEKLQKLVPEARIGIAHGQMAEKELELVMHNQFQLFLSHLTMCYSNSCLRNELL